MNSGPQEVSWRKSERCVLADPVNLKVRATRYLAAIYIPRPTPESQISLLVRRALKSNVRNLTTSGNRKFGLFFKETDGESSVVTITIMAHQR